jgi:hypothetical protein
MSLRDVCDLILVFSSFKSAITFFNVTISIQYWSFGFGLSGIDIVIFLQSFLSIQRKVRVLMIDSLYFNGNTNEF